MDYRKFLGVTKSMVLPYFGGLSVRAPDRRLRVAERVAAGWWHFEVKGRMATAKEPAEAPELSRLPAVRGHLVRDWLFTAVDTATRLHLMPDEEPELLTPATGRVWAGDDVVFDCLDFQQEPEEAAHGALLAGETIAGLKGATPSLRAAFGYAKLERFARDRGVNVSVRESVGRTFAIADGTLEPEALVDEIESRIYQLNPDSLHRAVAAEERRRLELEGTLQNVELRAAAVLAAAGANMLSGRSLGGQNYEVRFEYLNEQFIAVVDWSNLHVYDAGICLEGADEMLGLDSLPSVIAEAVSNGELHITRH